jgi:hypothetical protein
MTTTRTNLASSPTMQRALAESFLDDPRVADLEDIREGRDVWCDETAWEQGQDAYEERLFGGAA